MTPISDERGFIAAKYSTAAAIFSDGPRPGLRGNYVEVGGRRICIFLELAATNGVSTRPTQVDATPWLAWSRPAICQPDDREFRGAVGQSSRITMPLIGRGSDRTGTPCEHRTDARLRR